MTSHKAYLFFIWSLIGSIVLLCITFFLAFSLFRYADELKVVSQFYTVGIGDSSRQLDVVPFDIEKDKSTLLQLDEMMIRYYITQRYASIPDKIEMGRRWHKRGFLARLTNGKIYKSFIPDLEKKIKTLPQAVITVDILDIRQSADVKRKKGIDFYTYTVDFDLYARASNGEAQMIQKKRVILQVGHFPGRVFWNKRFNTPYGFVRATNPYGFAIDDFSESDRK